MSDTSTSQLSVEKRAFLCWRMVRLKAVTRSPHKGVLDRAASVPLKSGLVTGDSPTLET